MNAQQGSNNAITLLTSMLGKSVCEKAEDNLVCKFNGKICYEMLRGN